MSENLNKPNMDYDTFFKIINNLHDEIMVFDNNYNLVYLNNASYKHYGIHPSDLIGKNFFDLVKSNYWKPSTLPIVYKTENVVALKQKTIIGSEVITTSTPILDNEGNIEYVGMCVNDINTSNELYQNSQYDLSCADVDIQNNDTKIIYQSKEMENIMALARKISKTKAPSLILGETGTGKSLLAKYMHLNSDRSDKPFININCACINHNLIESELFGYAKGSFSGANKEGKKGLMELANGGTLFLDEISEIPYSLQAKFLQVIQDGEFIPIGGQKSIHIDIKIITATNCNLEQMVSMGNFRKDLYYRLNVFEVQIPSLKGRTPDIIKLTYYYLNLYNNLYKRNHSLSEDALKIITNYSWPGNIRELSHLIEKLVVIIDDAQIKSHHLPKNLYELDGTITSIDIKDESFDNIISNIEKQIITKSYETHKNSTKVAKELSISQSKAYRLIKKYINNPKDI